MRIALEFYVSEVLSSADLDELISLIRDSVEEKIGEVDYTIEETYINLEIEDE